MIELRPLTPHIVIGANYGDEGKGATVNYLAHRLSKVRETPNVVRFNGGSQAGHTVQLKDGPRHVFRMYGSGTLQGSASRVSEHCLVDISTVMQEATDLAEFTKGHTLWIHPKAKIITPLDVILNQLQERSRGIEAHGSCGQGIGTTMERNLAGATLNAGFIYEKYSTVKSRFDDIVKYFVEQMWGIKFLDGQISKGGMINTYIREAPAILETFFNSSLLQFMEDHIGDGETLSTNHPTDNVIFEGAQGLLLDEDDLDHQPHVTWSKTGSHNAALMLREMKGARHSPYFVDKASLYYVTRPYLTRHGAGPIHAGNEVVEGEPIRIIDPTNVHNAFQGTLRTAVLDLDKLKARIDKDEKEFCKLTGIYPSKVTVNVVVTCLDQRIGWSLDEFKTTFPQSDYNIIPLNGLEG